MGVTETGVRNMDPGWLILFFNLILEVLVVVVLIMPFPINAIRRFVLDAIAGALGKFKFARYVLGGIMALNVVYFAISVRYLYNGSHHSVDGSHHIKLFRTERNLYITGFSPFLAGVIM